MTAACSETDRIVATSTPVTPTAAVVPTTAAPAATATSARPPSTTPSVGSAAATPPPSAATSASPSASSAASLPPGASLPPMPAQPALPSGTTVVASGTVAFALAAGQTRTFEAADLASSRGASPPPSAALVWTVAWRATDPLVAAWYRQTSRTELGRGRWGTADLGGAGFELHNDSATNAVGELVFTIATR